jgi:hypothetical protein
MNPNMPPDPPASISAAELRRRLLASTPPPAAAPEPPAKSSSSLNMGDVLSKLRMPGQSGAAPPPPVMPDVAPEPAPYSPAATINRRPPVARGSLDVGGSSFGMPASPFGMEPPPATAAAPASATPPGPGGAAGVDPAVARLKEENKELRKLLSEMKQLLQEASEAETQNAAKISELTQAVTEKQRLVDDLQGQMQAIEEQIASGALGGPAQTGPPKTRTELEEWADELERDQAKLAQERKKMDEDRRQLREDEEALEQQMKNMEVSMARERAMMARQEMELKRLSSEIQHELEIMQRGDASLRQQMEKFQRRAQDVMQGKLGGGPGGPPPTRR